MFQFARGHILEVNTIDGKDFAKVAVSGLTDPIDSVLIVYPNNTSSKPLLVDRSIDTNQILLEISINGQVYGHPYNIPLQDSSLKAGEYKIGNSQGTNSALFKADGSIIISNNIASVTLQANGNIELDAGSGKITIDNTVETLQGLITQLISTLQSLQVTDPISGSLPITAATSASLTALQTDFDNLLE